MLASLRSRSAVGQLRLQHVVGAGRAAAEMRLGDVDRLEPGRGEQRLRLAVQLLAVLQRAGRVIGDPHSPAFARRPQAELGAATSRHVAGELADPRRLVGIGRVLAQHEAVILDRRAAARGVDDDRVEPARRRSRGPRRRCWRGRRRARALPGRDDAASAPQQPLPLATTTSQPCRVSSRIVASLISGASTCWAQPGSSATRIRRSPSAGKTCGRSIGDAAGTRRGARLSIARSRARQQRRRTAAPAAPPRAPARNRPAAAAPRRAARRSSRSSERAAVMLLDMPAAVVDQVHVIARPTGRWSCRRGRTGSGRYA